MSHFTKVKTQIKEAGTLEKVLSELEYMVVTNGTIRGYDNIRMKADFVVQMENGYDIGFIKQGDVYSIVADWQGTSVSENEFVNQIIQKYAEIIIQEEMQVKGYQCEKQQMEDGTVKLTMTRWE